MVLGHSAPLALAPFLQSCLARMSSCPALPSNVVCCHCHTNSWVPPTMTLSMQPLFYVLLTPMTTSSFRVPVLASLVRASLVIFLLPSQTALKVFILLTLQLLEFPRLASHPASLLVPYILPRGCGLSREQGSLSDSTSCHEPWARHSSLWKDSGWSSVGYVQSSLNVSTTSRVIVPRTLVLSHCCL